jgi:hypothetical protein
LDPSAVSSSLGPGLTPRGELMLKRALATHDTLGAVASRLASRLEEKAYKIGPLPCGAVIFCVSFCELEICTQTGTSTKTNPFHDISVIEDIDYVHAQ